MIRFQMIGTVQGANVNNESPDDSTFRVMPDPSDKALNPPRGSEKSPVVVVATVNQLAQAPIGSRVEVTGYITPCVSYRKDQNHPDRRPFENYRHFYLCESIKVIK